MANRGKKKMCRKKEEILLLLLEIFTVFTIRIECFVGFFVGFECDFEAFLQADEFE